VHGEISPYGSHFDEQIERSSALPIEGVAFLASVVRRRDGPTTKQEQTPFGGYACSRRSIYLGCWFLMAGMVYYFFGFETRGRSNEQIDRELMVGNAD
jgi:hypothetical protein